MAKWIIDPDHSVAAFTVKHMMLVDIRGQFNKVSGEIYFDPLNISGSSVTAEIDVAGITTGVRKRDDHLLSPDLFEISKYPKILFKSNKIEKIGENQGRVTGDLTIHAITRPITFDAECFGPVKSPFGGELTLGFTAAIVINRYDYGITWNETMEGGGLIVSKEVRIYLDIEADLSEG